MKRDPRVTRYIGKRAPFARPILRRLRSAILGAGRGIEEDIKWGMPTFLYQGKIVCGIAGFKAHCALWFKNGGKVVGAKPDKAMGHFGRIKRLEEVPSAASIRSYVRKGMNLISGRTS